MGALQQEGLCTSTLEIVQQDGSCARPEKSFSMSHYRISTAQLVTHDLGIREIPCIVAYRAPPGIWIQLNTALTLVLTTHQFDHSFEKYKRKFSLVENCGALILSFEFFFLPAEGSVVVLLVGVFSVTLKSRPTIKWFAKAKSNREQKQENLVMPLCSGSTQEVSGDQRNSMLSLAALVINIL